MEDLKDYFWKNGSKYYHRNCDYCDEYYEGRGQFYCSRKCSQKHGWIIGKFKGHKIDKLVKEKIRQSKVFINN